MNCANHPEVPAVAFCRTCGKPVCQACQRAELGTIFCAEHAPAPQVQALPVGVAAPADRETSPGLAFVLGLLPGVGAIYNGQYAKGIIHVVIMGVLISILNSDLPNNVEPIFGLLLAIWCFYMPFEAYHTARKRQRGEPVDEFSSLIKVRSAHPGFPIGPLVLIAAGVVFLLNSLRILRMEDIFRFWPVGLIALGAYMLYGRMAAAKSAEGSEPLSEVRHEQ